MKFSFIVKDNMVGIYKVRGKIFLYEGDRIIFLK